MHVVSLTNSRHEELIGKHHIPYHFMIILYHIDPTQLDERGFKRTALHIACFLEEGEDVTELVTVLVDG